MRAARWSAGLGVRVALSESDRLGGTCVIRGCIPKKLMVYGAEFTKHFQYAPSYGWKLGKPVLNWNTFQKAIAIEVKRLEGIYHKLLKSKSVQFLHGRASLVDSHTVAVGKKQFTSRYILIATGGYPRRLAIPGAELASTSEDMFTLKTKPKSLLVLGAGYIALEFASIFNQLGVKVKLLFRGKKDFAGF